MFPICLSQYFKKSKSFKKKKEIRHRSEGGILVREAQIDMIETSIKSMH